MSEPKVKYQIRPLNPRFQYTCTYIFPNYEDTGMLPS
jgi:hypothetical protein